MPRASSPDTLPDNDDTDRHSVSHLDFTVTCLWILVPLTATFSLVIVCVGMTTNQWLLTEEKMTNPNYNGTGDKDYLAKNTVSGLWILCYTNPGEKEMHCLNIDYFPKEDYSPDPNDSTLAIPYAVTKSALFFFMATLLLFLGECFCLFGHLDRHRRLFTFISGLMCIISGLLMLFGLVMYISVFKAEVGSKLRPKSQLQPPQFTYRYGYSFLLIVSGFMSTEIAGTCAVFLYIYWHQREWKRKRDEFYGQERKMSSSSVLMDHHPALYPCRRHPQIPPPPPAQIMRPCSYVSPPLQRRFYLERAGSSSGFSNSREGSPCLSRSHHVIPAVAGSVRDISSSFYTFPAPPSGVYQQHPYYHHEIEFEGAPPPIDLHHRHHPHHYHHPHHQELSSSRSSFFPRDATTNTVSTTADINSCEGAEGGIEEEYSPSLQHENEFVTFDLEEHTALPLRVLPEETTVRRGYDTLRRTTPV